MFRRPPRRSPRFGTTTNIARLETTTQGRFTQAPVEAVISPDDGFARFTQAPVEVVILPDDGFARFTQAPVEVVIQILNPQARFTQAPVEVVVKNLAVEEHTVIFKDLGFRANG